MIALAVLAFAALLSLAVGARSIPLADVVDALLHGGNSQSETIIRDLRVPRTAAGDRRSARRSASAGALMQALTRNPLADPGLLGVNAGASAAVVIALGARARGRDGLVWFAFLGAAVASVAVYAIGTAGRGGATPVRLALAGTAITAALTAVIYGIALTDEKLLQQYNFWSVGALGGRGRTQLEAVAAVHRARDADRRAAWPAPLNALALGDDSARALGRTRRRGPGSAARSRSRCCAARRRPPPGRCTSSG